MQNLSQQLSESKIALMASQPHKHFLLRALPCPGGLLVDARGRSEFKSCFGVLLGDRQQLELL